MDISLALLGSMKSLVATVMGGPIVDGEPAVAAPSERDRQ